MYVSVEVDDELRRRLCLLFLTPIAASGHMGTMPTVKAKSGCMDKGNEE